MTTLDSILSHLAGELGLGELKFDDDGICTLSFDGHLKVNIENWKHTGECVFSCIVGAYSHDTELEVLRSLAAANFAWAGTGGATLGANLNAKQVMLVYKEESSTLEWPRFQQLLQGFVNTAFEWHERLANVTPDTGTCPDFSYHTSLRA